MRSITFLLLFILGVNCQLSVGTYNLLWAKVDIITILGLEKDTQYFIMNTVKSNLTIGEMTNKFQDYINKMPAGSYEKPRAQSLLECFKYIKSILKQKSSKVLSLFTLMDSMADMDNNSVQDYKDKMWGLMSIVDSDPGLRLLVSLFGPNVMSPFIVYIFQDINYYHLKEVIIEGKSFNPQLLKKPSSLNDTSSLQEMSADMMKHMKPVEKKKTKQQKQQKHNKNND